MKNRLKKGEKAIMDNEIKKQEKKFGVKIEITDYIDQDHLNCIWYGGSVGRITGYKGHTIDISANGDIRIFGKINGEEIELVDKSNSGRMYQELALPYGIDDKTLNKLVNADPDSDEDYLVFENNNWFEVNLIDPENNFVDLSYADNILDDNLLECFKNIEEYFAYIDD